MKKFFVEFVIGWVELDSGEHNKSWNHFENITPKNEKKLKLLKGYVQENNAHHKFIEKPDFDKKFRDFHDKFFKVKDKDGEMYCG